ncbi:MAG: Uma2 family endonuclease [Deltaproteobacteria bacterium]|nr:Uma2 family endonuclease [Deltaproteobacteria bacterium]
MSSLPAASHPGMPATFLDLERVPEGYKGEIIAGVLYTQPRPRPAHQDALGTLFGDIDGPFRRGKGGPGGWWILVEPGIAHPEAAESSPDMAGWRRERTAQLPPGPVEVVPDWICESLSPSNRRYDLLVKKRFYAKIGVQHLRRDGA